VRYYSSAGKNRITIRLDNEILEYFRKRVYQMGGNYQTLINDALHEYRRRGWTEAAVREGLRGARS
jgi:predicted DNA binding CopG/RHH family protein